jgi:hypothetical protein
MAENYFIPGMNSGFAIFTPTSSDISTSSYFFSPTYSISDGKASSVPLEFQVSFT